MIDPITHFHHLLSVSVARYESADYRGGRGGGRHAPNSTGRSAPHTGGGGSGGEVWQYRDPEGEERGPYTAAKMVTWVDKGFFSGGLEVRKISRHGTGGWTRLSVVLDEIRREAAIAEAASSNDSRHPPPPPPPRYAGNAPPSSGRGGGQAPPPPPARGGGFSAPAVVIGGSTPDRTASGSYRGMGLSYIF